MDDAGVVIRIRDDLQIVSVSAMRECKSAVAERARSRYRLTLRDGPFCDLGEGVDALGIGRRRWMFIRYHPDETFVGDVTTAFDGLAAVCDQSDAYVIFELTGKCVRPALAKGVPVDLHPKSFTSGDIAVTNVAHINVVLWQLASPAAPAIASSLTTCFCVAVPRSYAGSFTEFLLASAREFGTDFIDGPNESTAPGYQPADSAGGPRVPG